jgi:hypothetical protein
MGQLSFSSLSRKKRPKSRVHLTQNMLKADQTKKLSVNKKRTLAAMDPAKKPLNIFLGRAHLRISSSLLIFCTEWSGNQSRIHNHALFQ